MSGRRAVLFDLDGTLVDSVPDLAASANLLLERRQLAPLGLDDVRAMVGNGIEKLVERAFAARGLDLRGAAFDAVYDEMIAVYGERLTVETTLMPGARAAIERLHGDGVRIAVVTNKAQAATDAILAHFGLSPLLGAVVGGDVGLAKKPAADILLAALARMDVDPAGAVLVGDSPADAGAARAAGLPVVLVRGGYTTVPVDDIGADAVIDGFDDLEGALGALFPVVARA